MKPGGHEVVAANAEATGRGAGSGSVQRGTGAPRLGVGGFGGAAAATGSAIFCCLGDASAVGGFGGDAR